jgi:hypothetical protein
MVVSSYFYSANNNYTEALISDILSPRALAVNDNSGFLPFYLKEKRVKSTIVP